MSTLLVIRHIVGWQERVDGGIDLCPCFPVQWHIEGRELSIGPLHHRGETAWLTYRCLEQRSLEVHLEWRGTPQGLRVVKSDSCEIAASAPGHFLWVANKGDSFCIEPIDAV